MNENNYLNMSKYHYISRSLAENNILKKNIEHVIKFHRSTSMIPTEKINNLYSSKQKRNLINQISSINTKPNFTQRIHNLDVNFQELTNKDYKYDKSYILSIELLSEFLIKSFSSISNRAEPSDKIHTVLPILINLSNSSIKGLSAGSYYYNDIDKNIILIKEWNPQDLKNLNDAFLENENILSDTAIAYAIDVQKAVSLYGKRGYRNALIEIGAMKQSFRETILSLNGSERFTDHICTQYVDTMVSNICGINVRLALIALVQWFGKIDEGSI